MIQFSLSLDRTQQRPVILLNNSLTALLDTGAYFPIWSDDDNHMFNITVPDKESVVRNLVIEDKDGKMHVLCNSVQEISSGN